MPDADFEAVSLEWRRLEELHYEEYLRREVDLGEQRRRRAAGLLRHLGLPRREPADLDQWFTGFLAGYRESWALFDDVLPALDALATEGLRLGAITNADGALQRAKLAGLGIAARFEVVIASSEVGAAKPERRIFAAACAEIDVGPGRASYVGDRLDTDARGARDAGLLGIWLNRERARPPADDVPTLSSLTQLPALMRAVRLTEV